MDGNIEKVKECIEAGVNVNVQTYMCDDTALILASDKNYIEIVRLLLEVGADTKIKDFFENTALDEAKARGHIEIIKLLENADCSWSTAADDCRFLA